MMPERPGRSMRLPHLVAAYWAEVGWPFVVDADAPRCFRCQVPTSRWSNLDRAHLVDRARDGLDIECNLVMLCHTCHRVMPSFGNSAVDELAALLWVVPMDVDTSKWPEPAS